MALRMGLGLQHALPRGPLLARQACCPRSYSSLAPSSHIKLQSTWPTRLPITHSSSSRHSSPLPAGRTIDRLPIAALRRAFTTSRTTLIRSTYFPKGSGYGGGGGAPPPRGWFRTLRRRIDRIPAMTIIYTMIGLNLAVFGLWQYAIDSHRRFGDPSLYKFLFQNFIINENNIMSGRIWTLLTACFSHSSGSHILMNCLGLYFIAPTAAGLIGTSAFLGLYLGGGIFASITSLLWHRARKERFVGSEGASGAIYSCLAFYAALLPNTTFLLFFVVPMPAWLLVGGIFAYDCYGAIFKHHTGTDSAGHVGGVVAGLAAALMFRRRGMGGFRGGRPRWR